MLDENSWHDQYNNSSTLAIMKVLHRVYLFLSFLLLVVVVVEALSSRQLPSRTFRYRTARRHLAFDPSHRDEEEVFTYNVKSRFLITSSNNTSANYLDDLTPPPINWARDSILFSENPATKRNNAAVQGWKLCRQYLPPVFTGTWPWRETNITERNPLGALYNMIVVRIPTIGIGIVYIKNLVEGHPLIMDFGQGAFEMSPIAVFAVLALILA